MQITGLELTNVSNAIKVKLLKHMSCSRRLTAKIKESIESQCDSYSREFTLRTVGRCGLPRHAKIEGERNKRQPKYDV